MDVAAGTFPRAVLATGCPSRASEAERVRRSRGMRSNCLSASVHGIALERSKALLDTVSHQSLQECPFFVAVDPLQKKKHVLWVEWKAPLHFNPKVKVEKDPTQ